MFTIAVQLAFNRGWILSFVYPLFALLIGTLGTLAVLYLSEAIERERVARPVLSVRAGRRGRPGDLARR